MAFGKGSNRNPNRVAYSFKIKTKDLPAPIFEVSKRDNKTEKWEVLPESATNVSGKVVGLDAKDFKHEGKLISSVNLTLEDGDDVYFITFSYTNIGRNAMNSLLNLKDFETPIEVRLYQTKPKEGKDGKEAKSFPAVAIAQGEELVKWAYSLEDLPKIEKIKFKGEWQSDTTNIDEFFKTKMTEFSKVIKSKFKRSTPAKKNESAASDENEHTSDSEDHGAPETPDEDDGGAKKPLF